MTTAKNNLNTLPWCSNACMGFHVVIQPDDVKEWCKIEIKKNK